MKNFRLTVKSFIVNEKEEVLLLKRRDDDPHSPGVWEIPGGRLEWGEDPQEGLRRETFEETGLKIEILDPIKVRHFTRDDDQIITLISFLCKPLTDKVKLGEEHVDFIWADTDRACSIIHPGFKGDIERYNKNFKI